MENEAEQKKEREWTEEELKAEGERLKREYEAKSKFLKFEDGQQSTVKFLDNGGYPYTNQKFTDNPEQVDFHVSVDGHEKTWAVNTKSKLYRQLIEHAVKFGKLKGATLVIKREGLQTKTKYTIMEIAREK